MNYAIASQKPKKCKQYGSDLEKKLMVDNLRSAVEIFGKDCLREGFNARKKQILVS
jgi:hypothetical protein